VAGVAGQVIADAVVEREASTFDEHVNDGRGDGFGRRIRAERHFGCDRNLFGIGWIIGAVAPAVPDRAVEHDPTVVSQAQLDRRVHPGPIPMPHGLPDPLDGCRVDGGVVLFANRRHGIKVCRDPDSAVRGHGCFLCKVADKWCCNGWPTAPNRSV